MSSYMAKAETVQKQWFIIDAKNKVLGRLASELASRLRGKDKPEFTPHVDMGDFFIIINANQIRVTGNKAEDKVYYRHTGHPGGIKEQNFNEMKAKYPERIIETAVRGMLPRGPLGRQMFRRLKVYANAEHPHMAQQPVDITDQI